MLSSLLIIASGVSGAVVSTDHLRSQLVAETTEVVAGQPLRLGLLFEHDPHWHTYWANPGDSGLPTRLSWKLPDGVEAGAVQWPMPSRFDLGDIVNYGYEGRTLLPIVLQVPADFDHSSLSIELEARWLICQEECIPGKAQYALQLPLARQAQTDPRWQEDFRRAERAQPQSTAWTATLNRDGEQLTLRLSGALPSAVAAAEWYPLTPRLVANSAVPEWQASADGGELRWRLSEFFSGLPPHSEWWLRVGDEYYRLQAHAAGAPAVSGQ